MNRCAIFAGGDMPITDNDQQREILRKTDYIICADCGYRHVKELGLTPDLIVGDFDSYTEELPDDVEIISTVPEKDDTDTLMAVKKAIELGYKNIDLYGAMGGGRIEHSIANVQTMIYAFQQGCDLTIRDKSVLRIQSADDGEVSYHDELGELYFSVFALTERVNIDYLRGVKYPLENHCIVQSFPIGVSNEITEGTAKLSIKSGLALIVTTPK